MKRHPEIPSGDTYFINDLDTIKLISDPLRLRMLEALREQPRTVKDVAGELGVVPTKLYYHVRLLEERGLLRVASTRVVSGIIEKHYQTVAYRLSVDRRILEGSPAGSGLEALLSVVMDEARGEMRSAVDGGLLRLDRERPSAGGLVLGRRWFRLTPARADAFVERLTELHQEFDSNLDPTTPPGAGERIYEMLLGFYEIVGSQGQAVDTSGTPAMADADGAGSGAARER